jgi:hypothetical protein
MSKRNRISIRAGYIFLVVAMVVLWPALCARADAEQGFREGVFKATIMAKEYFAVKLIKDKQGEIKVQWVKQNLPGTFAGGVEYSAPVGKMQAGKLVFDIPIPRYMSTEFTIQGITTTTRYVFYSAELTPEQDGSFKCALTKIDHMSGDYENMRFNVMMIFNGSMSSSEEDTTEKSLLLTLKTDLLPASQTTGAMPPGAILIYTIPPQYKTLTAIEVLPDLRTFGFAGSTDSGGAVNFNGAEVAAGLDVATGLDAEKIVVEVKSGGILFIASRKGRELRILNGNLYPPEGAGKPVAIASFTVSPNGKIIAYTTQESDGYHLWVNGKCIYSDRKLNASRMPGNALQITDSGIAYAVLGEYGKVRLLSGESMGPEYDSIYDLQITPDGKHQAYRASKGMKRLLILDGAEVDTAVPTSVNAVVLSPDGKQYRYFVERDACIDSSNLLPLDRLWSDPAIGTSKTVNGVEINGTKSIVVGDQKDKCDRFSKLISPVTTADGKTVAWAGSRILPASSDGKTKAKIESFIFINGKKQQAVGDVKGLLLNESGHLAAYATELQTEEANQRSRRQVVVIHDKPGKAYDTVSNLMIGPDKSVVYIATLGDRWYVVSGSQESTPFDRVWPPVIKDGKLVYAALQGRAILSVAVERKTLGLTRKAISLIVLAAALLGILLAGWLLQARKRQRQNRMATATPAPRDESSDGAAEWDQNA